MVVTKPLLAGKKGPTRKVFREGMHRVVEPEKTLAKVRPLMPVMGVTRIANITGLDNVGIPVVMVCRPNSRSLAVAQGKGLDLVAAKVSGIMESIESYHAERITLPLKLNTYEELRYTHNVVATDTLPRIEGSQFDPYFRILWIEGYDLLQDEPVWLPYEIVHTDYTLPLPSGSGCFPTSSSGLASGNHSLEAIGHAVCELVERDAITLWHLLPEDGQRRTRIDAATVGDTACHLVLEKLDNAGVAAAVWDITSDISVPAFLCQLMECDEKAQSKFGWATGTGCHPVREIALLRAVTEAAQARLIQITGSRDDLGRRFYRGQPADVLHRRREIITTENGSRRFDDVPSWDRETFEDDIAWLMERLRKAGLDRLMIVDLTRPEFGLPVVRAVIPGLEDGVDAPNYLPGSRAIAALEG